MNTKFRLWDDKNKKWLLGYEHPNVGGFSMMGEVMIFGEYSRVLQEYNLADLKHLILMQSTGIQDKNKIEIYQGDKVNYAVKKTICADCVKRDHRSELTYDLSKFCPDCGKKVTQIDFITEATVEFRNGGFCYYKEPKEGYYQSWPLYVAEIYITWVEVTGNIYSN